MLEVIRDYFRRRKLRKLLADPRFEFRKSETLAKATGTGGDKLVDLLKSVGARPAYRNSNLWGPTDKVGLKPRRRRD